MGGEVANLDLKGAYSTAPDQTRTTIGLRFFVNIKTPLFYATIASMATEAEILEWLDVRVQSVMSAEEQMEYLLSVADSLKRACWESWLTTWKNTWSTILARNPDPNTTPKVTRWMTQAREALEKLESPNVALLDKVHFPDLVVSTVPPLKKRKRGSQWTAAPEISRECQRCSSAQVIEDVDVGSAVCIQCGLIQPSLVTETAVMSAYTPRDGITPVVVHRYSRLVYLRSIVQSIQAETKVEMSEEIREQIRNHCERTGQKSAEGVRESVRRYNLPYRLMRHSTTVACQLFPEFHKTVPQISQENQRKMFRLFRGYENVWDRASSASWKAGRKKFVNYRELWNVLADKLFLDDVPRFPPMEDKKLRKENLYLIYELSERL